MSVEDYNEKLVIIKKFYNYLGGVLEKSYDNEFEDIESLSAYLNLYLNKDKNEHLEDDNEKQNENIKENENIEENDNNEEYDSSHFTESEEDLNDFTENLIKRSHAIGTNFLSSAVDFINETTQDLSKINLYNKFRDPIERMKKFLDNSNVK